MAEIKYNRPNIFFQYVLVQIIFTAPNNNIKGVKNAMQNFIPPFNQSNQFKFSIKIKLKIHTKFMKTKNKSKLCLFNRIPSLN